MSLLARLCPQPPWFGIDWAAIERVIDRDAMAATPQGAEYHAEGDVWIHTGMVCEALIAMPGWRSLDADARAIVFAGALLHDVGKPACTRHEPDGRISSRGHSGRGEVLARQLLWGAGVPFGAREHVCALVRHHQVPFFLVDSEPAVAQQTLARLSLVTRCDWLALVAEADARGRRCRDSRDQGRILDNTALFVELAREEGALDRPRRFPTDHTRFVYLRAGEPARRSPDVIAHDDTRCEVVVMSGLPAAGKDAWLARHGRGMPVIGLDALREELDVDAAEGQGRVIAAARERARELLRGGQSFAWNATNLGRPLRATLIDLLVGYAARVHLVYVEVPAGVQAERNRARAEPVPRAAIERMLQRWSPPAPSEAHRVTYAIDDDRDDGGDGRDGDDAASGPPWPP
ncbi:MAG TPA: AAA family ATPase [Kofleriaceae bacterium]|nr:AAA family ATPase [Kofleriaceae bacterium]